MPPTGTKKSPGRTPKPVGKKKKTTTSSLPPLGPKPTAGKLPQGKLTPGDKRFIGKQAGKLRAARREGVAAATSQLESIVSGVGKQGRKLTKESNRVIAGMNRLAENEKQFQSRQRRGVEIDTQSILGRTSATGARSGYMDMGVTSGRRRQSVAGAKLSGALTDAAIGQAKGTKKAGQRAFQSIKAAEKQAAGDSMTILDVLAAERKSEDQRFLTEMRYNIRSQRMQQQFQLMMANLGFEQDIYKMRLENRLAADYLEWQNENGYLLKPEEQAALDWKYKKKELDYAYRAAQRDKDPAAARKWDTYNTAITDAIVETNQALSTPESREALMKAAAADPEVVAGTKTVEQALYGTLSYSQDALPRSVDAGVVNTVIRDMIGNVVNNDNNSEAAKGPGFAPGFDQVKEYILMADEDGTLGAYLGRHEGQLSQAHQNYKMLAGVALNVDAERDQSLTNDAGTFELAGDAVATAAAVGGGVGLYRLLKSRGKAQLALPPGAPVGKQPALPAAETRLALGAGPDRLALPAAGGTTGPDDLLGAATNSKAANANIASAAQQGRISPFKSPIEAGPIGSTGASGIPMGAVDVDRVVASLERGDITGAEADELLNVARVRNLGSLIGQMMQAGDEPLAVLRRANPKLYMEITHPWGYFTEGPDYGYNISRSEIEAGALTGAQ
jgi:hypothetical protein